MYHLTRAPAPTARDLMRAWRVTISSGMSVSAAAGLLAAAGADAAPVADPSGRCVGVFTTGDYGRWLMAEAPVTDVFSEGQIVAGAADRVCDHMTRRFGTTTPDVGIPDLVRRLGAAADPFLVVIDRAGRPMGVVCGLDVLVAEANAARAGTAPDPIRPYDHPPHRLRPAGPRARSGFHRPFP